MDIENKIKELKEVALNSDEVNELEQVKLIYGKNDSSRKLAEIYLLSLDNLSFFQKEKTKLKEIADEAKKVYEQFKASEIVTGHYLSVLENLLYVQEGKLEKETEIEAKRVYGQNKVSEKIARNYLSFLGTLAFHRKDKYELNQIVDDVIDLFNLHQGSKYIAQSCVDTLIGIVEFIIKDAEVSYIAEAIMRILQKHPKLIGKFDNYIDRLTVFGDFTKESLSTQTEILNIFIQKCDNENLIEYSKYSFIFESYGVLSDDEMKRFLEIFFWVQMIKAKLIVKDFEKLKFGHYTNGKVLQIHLKPNIKENENYKITSKSRLNNVNYMNDPSEGKVLDQFLELDSTLLDSSLKPSPWFLMSLTTAIDRLAMWSQYGAQAEGVCLVLNSSDFLEGKYTTGSYMSKGDSKRTSSDSNKELSPLEKLYKKREIKITYIELVT